MLESSKKEFERVINKKVRKEEKIIEEYYKNVRKDLKAEFKIIQGRIKKQQELLSKNSKKYNSLNETIRIFSIEKNELKKALKTQDVMMKIFLFVALLGLLTLLFQWIYYNNRMVHEKIEYLEKFHEVRIENMEIRKKLEYLEK